MAPYKAYEASDGWIVIAAANDNLFRRLSAALGHPEWPNDPGDGHQFANRVAQPPACRTQQSRR